MQFHEEPSGSGHRITGYADHSLDVGEQRYTTSIALGTEDGELLSLTHWSDEVLPSDTVAAVLEWKPALVLLGTGARHRFAPPEAAAAALRAGIALEAMNMGAACRTFNVLAGEGRRVAAILLLERPASEA